MPDSIVIALITSLFALLGAFTGSALSRRSEYEKWPRQERTQAFSVLITELHATRIYASVAYYDEPGTEQEKSIKVAEAFARFQRYASTARLFMSDGSRKQLSGLTNDLCISCTVQGGPANRGGQIAELLTQIQAVLEQELNYLPWKVRWPFK
jgi:hypothetical protein